MKATEFCSFFDFSIRKEHGYDPDGDEYNYIGTDNQGCFHNRYGWRVRDAAQWFDVCLPDYIDAFLEDHGFESSRQSTYYEEALKWIEADMRFKGTDIHEVIKCLVDDRLIEDDV